MFPNANKLWALYFLNYWHEHTDRYCYNLTVCSKSTELKDDMVINNIEFILITFLTCWRFEDLYESTWTWTRDCRTRTLTWIHLCFNGLGLGLVYFKWTRTWGLGLVDALDKCRKLNDENSMTLGLHKTCIVARLTCQQRVKKFLERCCRRVCNDKRLLLNKTKM